jgi:hypothetical protein
VQIDDIELPGGIRLSLAWSTDMSTDTLLHAVLPGRILSRRDGGKPDLVTIDGSLQPISITHTVGFSALCWGDEGQIGIDAERADRKVSPGLLSRMQHPQDHPSLSKQPIECWIIKESVLKCIGTGLRLGMNRISVQLHDKDRFSANWNSHPFHGILVTRHDIRLSIVHTTSPL